MPDQRPPTIDPTAARRWERVAPAASPWLHEEVARRMEDRLQWINLKPAVWADWEAVRGGLQGHALVRLRYPDADCFVVEPDARRAVFAAQALARPWWNPSRWKGGALHLQAPPAGGMQMLWSNMALHMSADPQTLIAQWHQALATDGFLMFSCLGPDSLRELRAVYVALGWPVPGHDFTDMHDWGDMLVQAGFAEPVMDMERIVLTYETPARLLQDLRDLGRNLHPGRFPAARGRAWQNKLKAALDKHLRDPSDGRLRLTFEIIYGHALKPKPRIKLGAESAVSLQDMRSMLRGPASGDKV
jgi:malonyl-CoA O-methyltransferase